MIHAVSYYRVSSDEQAQKDLSIPAQRKAILKYVQDQGDLKLVQEFRDEGESAYAPADRRPGFTEMIRFARTGEVQAILVHKLDRFSRNREESIIFKSLLKKHGVLVKSITEHYDPETPQGFLYEGMIEVINQFYSMNLATETIKGMAEAASRGYRTGGTCPHGYALHRVADAAGREHSVLVPGDPAKVAVVRRIYDLNVNKGIGVRTICILLNEEGLPSPTGKTWNNSTIGSILKNRAYVGDTVWNRRCNKNKAKVRAESEWIVVKDTHEPLIDRALFELRQRQAPKRLINLKGARKHVKWLLSGLMRCGCCGNSYVGRRQKWTRKQRGRHEPVVRDLLRYECSGRLYKGKTVCQGGTLNAEWIEGEVVRLLLEKVTGPDSVRAIEERVVRRIEENRRKFGYNAQGQNQRIAAVERKIENLYRAIAEGLDPARCKDEIAKLEAEKAQFDKEAEVLRSEDYHERVLKENLDQVRHLAASAEEFHAREFDERRQILELCIERIEVVAGQVVRVYFKVPFEDQAVGLPLNGAGRKK